MKRIIKFRVWNEHLWMSFPTSDAWHQLKDGEVELPKETILMQFTGLLDRNGKEIYEGDIFDCPYSDETENHHLWKVIFGEVSGGFVLQRIGKPCNQSQVHQTLSDMTRRKILGNIWENPELLK